MSAELWLASVLGCLAGFAVGLLVGLVLGVRLVRFTVDRLGGEDDPADWWKG
jgi:ABC-type nitrate/sulfonate/bicarbonate transport system permease component